MGIWGVDGPGSSAGPGPGSFGATRAGTDPVPRPPSQARLRAVHPRFPGTLGAGVRPAGPGDSILPRTPLLGGTLIRGQDGPLHILCLLFNYLILFDFIHKIISLLSI